MRIGLFLFLLILFNVCLPGMNQETDIEFEHLTIHDGLTQNSKNPSALSFNDVRDILQDNSGILWIATRGGGVNKLDLSTRKFNHYRNDPFRINSLSSNQVWAICGDNSGTIWVGTYGGRLNRLNPETGEFTHYNHCQKIHNPSAMTG